MFVPTAKGMSSSRKFESNPATSSNSVINSFCMLNSSSANNFPDFLIISRSWNHKLESSCCSFGTVFLWQEKNWLSLPSSMTEVVIPALLAGFVVEEKLSTYTVLSPQYCLSFVACGRTGTLGQIFYSFWFFSSWFRLLKHQPREPAACLQ